jgi:hypothetical protein
LGANQEDHGLRPAQANSLWDPISKRTTVKWTGGVTQVVACLLYKHEVLSPSPSPIHTHKKNKEITELMIM